MNGPIPQHALVDSSALLNWLYETVDPGGTTLPGVFACPTCAALVAHAGMASHFAWHAAVLFPESVAR